MKRIVIALGGNALGDTLPEQRAAVKITARAIVDLIADGHQVVVAHGNGPQVGMINLAMGAYAEQYGKPPVTLPVCTAMSQGYIGYDLQCALREELLNRGIHKPVVTLLTQVEVDGADPAFQTPTKPIGAFMTEAQASVLRDAGEAVMEDAGRGWRRVVASPRPKAIVELDTVRALLQAGQLVIACGGGGIPVTRSGNRLSDAAAVIDKDFASSLLARDLEADMLIILTAVERVAIRFNKPDQVSLDRMTIPEAEVHIQNGEFAPGSMLPKVQAAIDFARSGAGRTALITLLEKAQAAVRGETGTTITQ